MGDNLPPLPEPDAFIGMGDGMSIVVPPSEWARFNAYKVFTAEQMRAYAEEAVRMERERLSGAVGRFTDQVEEYARSRSEVAPEPTER